MLDYHEQLKKKVDAAVAPLQIKIKELHPQIEKVEKQLSAEIDSAAKLQERAAEHKATAGEKICENPDEFKKSLKELRDNFEDSETIIASLRDNYLPDLKAKLFEARQNIGYTVIDTLIGNRPSFCESTFNPLICRVLDSLKNLTDEREAYGEAVQQIHSDFGVGWSIECLPPKRHIRFAPKIPMDEIAKLQELLKKVMPGEEGK